MKNVSFRFPTSIKDIKVLWKEYTSKRYRNNIEVMRRMTEFYINNVLNGRWKEVSKGKIEVWTEGDKHLFESEMWDKCNEFISNLMK